MATIGKARLKKLLAKGLTGWEAGALLFREGLEREWGKQATLTDSEVATIRESLKTNEDREAYNHFLDTAMTVDRATHQACFGGMLTINRLLNARLNLTECKWLVIITTDKVNTTPSFHKEIKEGLKKRAKVKPNLMALNIQKKITQARHDLEKFLAFKTTIEDFYRLMGLKKFGGNLEECYRVIVSELKLLNEVIEELQDINASYKEETGEPNPMLDVSKLETIDITKVKPEAESLKMVRGWIAKEGTGDNWWKGAKPALELSEEAGEVEEEASLDG